MFNKFSWITKICYKLCNEGVDDKNRFYLLFFYKNNVTNRIHYEFIFPINIL